MFSVFKKRKTCTFKGVLTPTLQPVCNWFATRKKLKSQSGCKGRGKVFFKSPTSRRLKSGMFLVFKKRKTCTFKGVLTPTLQPVCNWFATRKKLKSQSGCKGRGKVFFKSPTSRRKKKQKKKNQSPIEISRELSFEHAQKTGRD